MKEKTLLRIAFSISVVGVLFLYFLSGNIETPRKAITRVSAYDEGKDLNVRGIVSDVFENDKVMIIKFYERNPKSMSAVVFSDGKFEVYPGQEIDVRGEVREYNGKMELVADEINVIK